MGPDVSLLFLSDTYELVAMTDIVSRSGNIVSCGVAPSQYETRRQPMLMQVPQKPKLAFFRLTQNEIPNRFLFINNLAHLGHESKGGF